MIWPSKKVLTALAVGVVIIGIASVVSMAGTPSLKERSNTISSNARVNTTDSDNDGLADWEEVLWGTDPNNPDSDNDGTRDGEEIDAGRNPKIAGPEDVLSTQSLIAQNKESNSTGPKTTTDAIARELFSFVIGLQQSGNVDQRDLLEFSDTLAQTLAREVEVKNTYTASDFSLITNPTKTQLKTYGNTLGGLIDFYSTGQSVSEIEIINEAIATNDSVLLNQLDPIVEQYKGALQNLINMPVPASAADIHISGANAIATIIRAIEDTRGVFTDPIGVLVALKTYEEAVIQLNQAVRDLEYFFARKDVRFSEDEPGYLFEI